MNEATPQFDSHALEYEAQCMQGVGLSGESKEFFARGRIDSLHEWWGQTGRAAPRFIVDYGCGIGDASPLLAKMFPESRVMGVDPSTDCIARARQSQAADRVSYQPLGEFAGSELGTADLVHVNGVLHHVEPAERPQFFRAIADLLAPDGVVALFENNPLNPGTRLLMARIPFDRDAIPVLPWEARRLMQDAGLCGVDTRFLFYFPRFLSALRPLERFLVRLPLGAQYGVFAVRGDSLA